MKRIILILFVLLILISSVNGQRFGQIIYGKIYLDGNPLANIPLLFLNQNDNRTPIERTNEAGEYLVDVGKIAFYDELIYQVVCYDSDRCPQKVFPINLTNSGEGFVRADRHIESCTPFYTLVMKFIALDPKTFKESSNQDYKDLKEEDLLNLDELIVQNNADCRIKGYEINLDATTPSRDIPNPFGIPTIEIPPLDYKQWYTLKFKERGTLKIVGEEKEFNVYEPSIDIIFKKAVIAYLGRQDLFEPGAWTFEATSRKSNSTERIEVNVFLKDSSGNIVQPRLKVFGKKQQEALDVARQSMFATILTALLASAITIFAGYQLGKSKEKREQKILLNNLKLQLKEVKKAIKGHKEELRKGTIPSYFLPKIEATTYLSTLDLKNLNDEEKTKARETIHEIDNKIWNINHLIDKSTDAIVLNNPSVVKMIKKEISSQNFKYHKHLDKMIKDLESILN